MPSGPIWLKVGADLLDVELKGCSMNVRRWAAVFAAAAGVSAVTAGPADAADTPGGAMPGRIGAAVEFQNLASGGCLDVVNFSTEHGAPVRESPCRNTGNQNWLIEPVLSAPGFFALRSINSNMCLDLRSGGVDDVHDGTLIQQWDCFPDSIGSEQWKLQLDNSGGPGALNLVTAVKGKCLDTNPRTGSALLHIGTCTSGSRSQMWKEQ
jgi:hypothetical protein